MPYPKYAIEVHPDSLGETVVVYNDKTTGNQVLHLSQRAGRRGWIAHSGTSRGHYLGVLKGVPKPHDIEALLLNPLSFFVLGEAEAMEDFATANALVAMGRHEGYSTARMTPLLERKRAEKAKWKAALAALAKAQEAYIVE